MDFISELINQYPWLSVQDADRIVKRAKMYYYGRRYPYEPSANDQTHPITNFVEQMWIMEACGELIERLGFDSTVGYKENNVSFTFDNAKLSKTLLSQIIPIAGAVF